MRKCLTDAAHERVRFQNMRPNHFPDRQSIRLSDYDYSLPGGYFVTVVVQSRRSLFGEIRSREMILNAAGQMVCAVWQSLPERYSNLAIDIFQVMPNHFHGILFLHDASVGAGFMPARDIKERATTRVAPTGGGEKYAVSRIAPALGQIIGAFKSITTHEYILGVESKGWPRFEKRLWQRNYYEHILRDQADYEQKGGYIFGNPANWEKDEENSPDM